MQLVLIIKFNSNNTVHGLCSGLNGHYLYKLLYKYYNDLMTIDGFPRPVKHINMLGIIREDNRFRTFSNIFEIISEFFIHFWLTYF